MPRGRPLHKSLGAKMTIPYFTASDKVMRKMIMLALASFLWKQVQKRMGRGAVPQRMPRRWR